MISTASNHAQLNNIVLAQRNLYHKCNVRCTCVHVPMNLCFNDVSPVCVIKKTRHCRPTHPNDGREKYARHVDGCVLPRGELEDAVLSERYCRSVSPSGGQSV